MSWAKNLLSLFGEHGEHWTKGVGYARNVNWDLCFARDKDAHQWNLVGAIDKLYDGQQRIDVYKQLSLHINPITSRQDWRKDSTWEEISRPMNYRGFVRTVHNFNDSSQWEDVKRLLLDIDSGINKLSLPKLLK